MIACRFCPRPAAGVFAATVLEGPADERGSWRRGLAPMCDRCQRLLAGAGRDGRALKNTGQRWFLGHTTGLFETPGAPAPRPMPEAPGAPVDAEKA